jgi:hypothetical protein
MVVLPRLGPVWILLQTLRQSVFGMRPSPFCGDRAMRVIGAALARWRAGSDIRRADLRFTA